MARVESGATVPAEPFLERATLEWLPAVGGENDRVTRAALEKLSGMLIASHQDYWLSDMMRSPVNADWVRGSKLLAESIRLNGEGDRESGYDRARAASAAFQSAGNSAGKMRADVEAIYSLSRSFQTAKCIQESGPALAALEGGKYPWARVQTLMARSVCLERLGEFSGALGLEDEAINLTERQGYRQLFLRAIGLRADLHVDMGDLQNARRQNYDGLKRFWEGTYAPLRAYQFYSDLFLIAERSRMWRLGYLMSSEAAPIIELAGNRTTEALARYRVAMFAGMTGRAGEAAAEIQRAEELLKRIGDQGSARAFRAVDMVSLATSYLENGELDLADKVLGGVSTTDVQETILLQIALHKTNGILAVRRHQQAIARREFEIALGVAENALHTVRTERDGANWAKETGPVYRELIRIAIDNNEADRGLTLWQVYRSASVTRETAQTSSDTAAVVLRGIARKLKGASVLSLIQFEDRLDGWLFDDRGIFSFRSPLSRRDAETACAEFRALASSPGSDPGRLREAGKRLYRRLLEPVEGRLRDGQPLAIQPDGPCAEIPFEVLVDAKGSYLVERMAIFTSPGVFAMERLTQSEQRVSRDLHAVIVGNPRLTGAMSEAYADLPDATREAALVAETFRRPLLLTGRMATSAAVQRALAEAEVFHFAGHGVSTSENGTLLLSPPEASSGASLLESAEVDGVVRKCRLAVLSACRSAAGERLGPFNPDSLVQAFWRARVPNVVATRWDVDSRVALQLVTGFYRFLLEGRHPVDALRAAQLEILKNPGTSHPVYWAAFHVFGTSIPIIGEALQ